MIISFRLNKGKSIKDKSKPVSIYFRYSNGRQVDYNVSLKIKVLVEDWDTEKQRVRNRTHIANKDEINSFLRSLENYFSKETIRLQSEGVQITYKTAKRIYDSYLKIQTSDSEEISQVTLSNFIEDFIEESKTRISLKTGTYITAGTIKTYKTFKNSFDLFCKENYNVDFEDVNLDFYHDYISWCEKGNLRINYIGKNIKTLKSVMSSAVEKGLTSNLAFRSKRFKVLKEEVDAIYLNLEELKAIYELDLSETPKLETIRDLFIIGAFTGLRVSDYNYLTSSNFKEINGVKLLSVEPQKTKRKQNKKVVYIPLHPYVLQILEKNDFKPPKRIPEQHINEGIKRIGEMAGIDSIESSTITKGGKEVTSNRPKYKMIQSHTARRSFCTNAYHMNMNMLDIMAISGHTSEQNFLKYIKVTAQERALKLANHDFFRTNLKVV